MDARYFYNNFKACLRSTSIEISGELAKILSTTFCEAAALKPSITKAETASFLMVDDMDDWVLGLANCSIFPNLSFK